MVKILVGLDGSDAGNRALNHASKLAKLIGDCEVIVAYVIEWSPFRFQTAEENEVRHKRREEEISLATSRIVDPAVKTLQDSDLKAKGVVHHGLVADTLISMAKDHGAEQIIVARSSEGGLASRILGTSTAHLVMGADVPVTVVG